MTASTAGTTAASYTLRQAISADEPLLRQVFAADRADEFAPLGLTPQQLEPLLEMQFRARQRHYGQAYPAAVDTVLCLEDGTPVGRHLVERQPTCYRGIDLGILPAYRNRGVGTWALRHIQQVAALEGVVFRLSVFRTNIRALQLYEHLGFSKVAVDDVAYEMEWQPKTRPSQTVGRPVQIEEKISLGDGSGLSRNDVLDTIEAFLRQVGLRLEHGPVSSTSFLPGVQMVANGLRIDTAALLHPGDLLHEAGHLAVMLPENRAAEFPSSTDAAEEMATLAWSYAAAIYLELPPEVVFHQHGYRGQSQSLLQDFQQSHPIGLPYLWWIGLTTQSLPEQPSIFPRMTRWLREASAEYGVHELTVPRSTASAQHDTEVLQSTY